MDGTDEPLVETFWALSRRLRAMAQEALAEWDVTPSQARALAVLRRGGPLRLGALAERLRIAPRSATEVVDELAARALVERRPDPVDHRATLVALTAHGEEVATASLTARKTGASSLFSRLPPPDQEELARLLASLRAAADSPPPDAPPPDASPSDAAG